MDHVKTANRVSVVSIIINTILSAGKLAVGILAHSSAMVSDAVHSASDVFSTIAVIIGVNLSAKDSDGAHPYGHERLEDVFSIILAVLLFVTGAGIGLSAIKAIFSSNYAAALVPGAAALIAAVVSIVVKEGMYHYTAHAAKKINSTALMADAWHHRSDALSSVGSFVGILGARLGFPICDPIASVIICLFILKAAVDIFISAINQMIDKACDPEVTASMSKLICEQEGVVCIDLIRTRCFGAKIFVDVEIGADGELTLYEAHDIAQRVHDCIESEFPDVKHCMVHVNPKNVRQPLA
ncbi:MAG: cation diffusion facilitator family transporter [Clostridiales bacterium]|nr:cation diffusion facilitator family transporter [Clostridiales bacterium]